MMLARYVAVLLLISVPAQAQPLSFQLSDADILDVDELDSHLAAPDTGLSLFNQPYFVWAAQGGSHEPWRLLPELLEGVTVTGWVESGVTSSLSDRDTRFNSVVTFNDRFEGRLNQLYVVTQKAIRSKRDWGARVDVLLGSDYVFAQTRGLELDAAGNNRWNSRRQFGVALPQFYAEAQLHSLNLKFGHFYTIVGYESVMAPDNFFYSHAYTMQYGEPFTHSGMLATWQPTDHGSLSFGLTNGWDALDRRSVTNTDANRPGFLGGYHASVGESAQLAFVFSIGDEPNVFTNRPSSRYLHSVVFQMRVTPHLNYVLQHDSGSQQEGGGDWHGVNQYFLYTINDCWQAGIRAEWFRDDDGARVRGVRQANDKTGRGANPFNGIYAGDFYELTAGVNWKPWPNWTMRTELRSDWYTGEESRVAGTPRLPLADGNSRSQVTAAWDVIVIW